MLIYYCIYIFAPIFMYFGARRERSEIGGSSKSRVKWIWYGLSFLILTVPAAIRWDVGTDFYVYRTIFETGNYGYLEKGFVWFCDVISFFSSDPIWFFVASSTLILGLIFLAIKENSMNPGLSLAYFIGTLYYFSSFNIIRQFIAISICFYSINFLKNKKIIHYSIVILIAFLFHKSAIMMLPLYFVLNRRYKAEGYLMLFFMIPIAVIFLRYFGVNIAQSLSYENYIENGQFEGGVTAIPQIAWELTLFFFCLRFLPRMESRDKYAYVLVNLQLINFSIYCCAFFLPYVNRISIYFKIFQILLFPLLFSSLGNRSIATLLNTVFLIGLSILMYVFLDLWGYKDVIPYQTVFGR